MLGIFFKKKYEIRNQDSEQATIEPGAMVAAPDNGFLSRWLAAKWSSVNKKTLETRLPVGRVPWSSTDQRRVLYCSSNISEEVCVTLKAAENVSKEAIGFVSERLHWLKMPRPKQVNRGAARSRPAPSQSIRFMIWSTDRLAHYRKEGV